MLGWVHRCTSYGGIILRYARSFGVDCPVSVAMTCVWWLNAAGHTGGTAGKSIMRPTFSPLAFSLRVEPLLQDFFGEDALSSLDWSGWASLGWARSILTLKLLCTCFLTHGDHALETDAGFLVIEHWSVPAGVRNAWAGLRRTGIRSVWAPADQESGHVGHAGGLVCLEGAPLSLPNFATSAFASCFAQCRALRSHVSIGGSRILHLVVVCGFQGAASDPEKLSLTDSLIDAVLGELAVAATGQPFLEVGDLNVEPTQIHCLLKGISAGSWFDLQASWAYAN